MFSKFFNWLFNREDISLLEQLNKEINTSIKYVSDGETDYWQAPKVTLNLGSGDCEDYAFLKQHLLANKVKKSRVVVVKTIYDKHWCHAVLVVTTFKGNQYVLDNQTDEVVPFYEYMYTKYIVTEIYLKGESDEYLGKKSIRTTN